MYEKLKRLASDPTIFNFYIASLISADSNICPRGFQKDTLCLEKTIKFLEDIEPFSTEKNKHFIDICKGGIDAIAEDYTVYNNERRDTK